MSPRHFVFGLLFTSFTPLTAADPKPRVDLLGDPLPAGAIARIGSTRFLPRPYLENVYFTPDGSTVIGRGADSVLTFWAADSGKAIFELRDPDLMYYRTDQSPDGTRLALFGQDKRGKPAPDATLRVYDTATRKPLWSKTLSDDYHVQHAVLYSADGKHIITGSSVDLRVWDAATGAEVRRVKARVGYGGLVLAPDGQTVAFGEQQIWLWQWATDALPRQIELGTRRFDSRIAFAADSKTIYGFEYGRGAHGYDVATGKFVGTVEESTLNWRSTSPDGKIVALADYDKEKRIGSVILRDATSSNELRRLPSGRVMIREARWSRNGKRLVGATAFRAFVWDVSTGKSLVPDAPGHEGPVTSLMFTSDGRLITAADDQSVRAWDPMTGKERARLLTADESRWWRLAASPDGSLLAGSDQPNEMRVCDSKTGAEIFRLRWSRSRTGGIFRIRFSADGQTLLSYGADFQLRAWDLVTGKLKIERRFRSDERLAPDADDDDEDMGRGLSNFLNSRVVDIGPDGDTLVLSQGKTVGVYSLQTGKERFKLAGDEQLVSALALSTDGKRLAVAGRGPAVKLKPGERPADFPVTVWDMTTAKQLCQFRVPGQGFYGVLMFTPDGKQIVTSSENESLHFWNATNGELVGSIDLPRRPTQVTFTPDGKLMAAAFSDPTVLIYDVNAALKRAKE